MPAKNTARSLHALGVLCGLAAGAWLGAAEAPTKLVSVGLSPFLISLAMVAGVFVARWTLPTMMKGTSYILLDLKEKPHLIVWAILAGALWAVANTLTVFAIRDVGLSIAFPLWNTNSLVGVFWGWFFFRELRGADWKGVLKVVGGALGIVAGATLLGYASAQEGGATSPHVTAGIFAALGAGLLWGTMYIPYRKAYLSGMNPVSFITVFTVGELLTMTSLALVFSGGIGPLHEELARARPALFWLFLGGFCWVLGDLFQQYAAKYIGIGRGIPLSNTNQLWGLAWGALVFGELAGRGSSAKGLIIGGSVLMIAGALGISVSVAETRERASWQEAMESESRRYGLRIADLMAAQAGDDPIGQKASPRRAWDGLIVLAALGVFVWLADGTERPPIRMDLGWVAILLLPTLLLLCGCAWLLWKRTRFS
ncbi:MAG: GRP family sugar transporter [Acidobacteriia bacterium]|nr:GRP family sugar transporter [Terriglobia bacterium]